LSLHVRRGRGQALSRGSVGTGIGERRQAVEVGGAKLAELSPGILAVGTLGGEVFLDVSAQGARAVGSPCGGVVVLDVDVVAFASHVRVLLSRLQPADGFAFSGFCHK